MQKETRLSKNIIKAIRKLGGHAVKYHGSQYGVKGHPDIYGVIAGRSFFLETKTPDGGDPRPDQCRQLELWARQRAITGSPTSVDEAVDLVLRGLREGYRVPASYWRDLRLMAQTKGGVVQEDDEATAADRPSNFFGEGSSFRVDEEQLAEIDEKLKEQCRVTSPEGK